MAQKASSEVARPQKSITPRPELINREEQPHLRSCLEVIGLTLIKHSDRNEILAWVHIIVH